MTTYAEPNPVGSFDSLRKRVERLLVGSGAAAQSDSQLSFALEGSSDQRFQFGGPAESISEFLDFLAALVPQGGVYLFGGVLRDLALLGREGFQSDVDVVVEGPWEPVAAYLESLNAARNRFGGYRLQVAGWPVDVWSAPNTWAVAEGLVPYNGIASLLQTTVLNWDAILMNWRSRRFICHTRYLAELRERSLDVVLEENPNPLGMAVRVFRHLSLKDARRISLKAASYLARSTQRYSYEVLAAAELQSYGDQHIEHAIYRLFAEMRLETDKPDQQAWSAAERSLRAQGVAIAQKQQELALG